MVLAVAAVVVPVVVLLVQPLSLAKLGPAVLEPDLKNKNKNFCQIKSLFDCQAFGLPTCSRRLIS